MMTLRKAKNFIHLLEAIGANIYFRFPSQKLTLIGVTGTDGKTTTTALIAHILKTLKKKVSFVTTIFAQIGDRVYDTGLHVTTPSSFVIQRFLRSAVEKGDEYFVLETTSHALDQNRVWGLKFAIGVLTNITHEHLDYHRTYENYVKAKEKLLKASTIVILNPKDQSYSFLSQSVKQKAKNYLTKLGLIRKHFPNLAIFNQYNYAAAFLACESLGFAKEEILSAMKSFSLPSGRLEIVYRNLFTVIVDFAHTPNAFRVLLPEVKKRFLGSSGRLVHVFGSAGLRDSLKRSMMGQYASQYADFIILTEEDYRTEDPKLICQQIISGFRKNYSNYEVIINRERAIRKAILMAKKGDVVLITGKGHEKSLCRGKIEYPWSDQEAVKRVLSKIIKKISF
ncbi:MAG: Mur ligase family protein [Patescibacteria group bacterium]|nr:Mur ligase family protein [Patescibacteria group bacterium]